MNEKGLTTVGQVGSSHQYTNVAQTGRTLRAEYTNTELAGIRILKMSKKIQRVSRPSWVDPRIATSTFHFCYSRAALEEGSVSGLVAREQSMGRVETKGVNRWREG